jgi:hypothetical protein
MFRFSLSVVVAALALEASGLAQVQTIGDVSFAVPDGWTYTGSSDFGAMVLKADKNF